MKNKSIKIAMIKKLTKKAVFPIKTEMKNPVTGKIMTVFYTEIKRAVKEYYYGK